MEELTNKNPNIVLISENLKKLRKAHKLKTSDVAKVINKSRQGYLNYETGTREIGINSLIELSSFYNISIDEIVGNPYSLRNIKSINYRTYELNEGALIQTIPTNISNLHEDIICVKQDELNVDFFWRTQTYQKGQVMLFEYYDKPYISKLYYNEDGGGFFFINDEPFHFSKEEAINLVFIGVLASKLNKNFHVNNFF